jgi:uncharacterized membrane protein YgdD (TMEM256/DUF423 family)
MIFMRKQIIVTASIFGLLAVIAGAFGAHSLNSLLTAKQLEIWHTAVEYQFYHVFALLFLSTFAQANSKLAKASYYFFTFGIICFSGSLYMFATIDMLAGNWPYLLGPVTPLGGLLFILGWLMLALTAIRNK